MRDAGQDRHTGAEVAVKFEPANTKQPQLLYEAKVLRLLSGGGASVAGRTLPVALRASAVSHHIMRTTARAA